MSPKQQNNPLEPLFRPPATRAWLPALIAADIGDPYAAAALGLHRGPANVPIKGGQRPRVSRPEHFLGTWTVVKSGFLGSGGTGYAEHANTQHRQANISPSLLALPIQWAKVMLSTVALNWGRVDLLSEIQSAALRLGRDIHADPTPIHMSLRVAGNNMTTHFAGVRIAPEQGKAFWETLDYGAVRTDLGGVPGHVNVKAVQVTLTKHLPQAFVRQFMQYCPA